MQENHAPEKKFRMLEEIYQQPHVFSTIWEKRNQLKKLAGRISQPPLVFLTAFGSSYHAALYGQFLFSHFLGIPALAAIPSYFLEQNKKLNLKNSVAIAISQSGEVEEVIEVLSLLKKRGSKTVSLTNNPNSKLASHAHQVVTLEAGPEKSIPATKTFTATIFNLQLLSAYLGARSLLKPLSKIPEFSRNLLSEEAQMKILAKKFSSKSKCLVLAPESLKPVAMEGSLKLKECAYMMAEPFEWREFFHGPVALMEKDTPGLLLPEIEDHKTTRHMERCLKKIGNYAYLLESKALSSAKNPHFAPIAYAVLLQLLAFHLALDKHINPDYPRHLQKIVRTSA